MGSRKLLILLLLLIPLISCYANKRILIKNCVLTENSMIIEVDLENVIIYRITGIYIDYKNIPKSITFEPEEIEYDKTDSKIVINLNLENIVLYINEEAELIIKISGGFIVGDIFIDCLISEAEPFYFFPNEIYERLRIIILDQYYIYQM